METQQVGPNNKPKRLISVPEAARRLGVSPKTIYSWISTGYMDGYKIGRLVKVDADYLEIWIIQHKAKTDRPLKG
jgi:excisionase family DNA binding protein